MKLIVYHLKTCDTCRKAIKALNTAGHELTLIDVRADGIPAQKLSEITSSVGSDILLNTRSTTWRGLSDAQKSDVTAEKAVALMQEHPTLMKRPVIDTGSDFYVGWKAEVQSQLI